MLPEMLIHTTAGTLHESYRDAHWLHTISAGSFASGRGRSRRWGLRGAPGRCDRTEIVGLIYIDPVSFAVVHLAVYLPLKQRAFRVMTPLLCLAALCMSERHQVQPEGPSMGSCLASH